MIAATPSLTKLARLPAEIGRIEFKAFDSCMQSAAYAPLLALLKGVLLDDTLPARADVPDRALHQLSARKALADYTIARGARAVLHAADRALRDDPDRGLLVSSGSACSGGVPLRTP